MIDVNFEETLKKNKIVRDDYYLSDLVFTYLFLPFWMYLLYFLYKEFKDVFYRNIYTYGFVPVVLIVSGYLLYKKAYERKLTRLSSPFSKEINKEIIKQYLDNEKFDIEYYEGDNLIATSSFEIFGGPGIQVTLIFLDGIVLLNVLPSYWKNNIPLLYKDISIRKDLEWEIKMWGKSKEQYLEP